MTNEFAPAAFMTAIANKLIDAGLNPLWLPYVADQLRQALARTDYAQSWDAAKRGEQQYLTVFAFPAAENSEDMMLAIDIIDHLKAKVPAGMIAVDLTETFRMKGLH